MTNIDRSILGCSRCPTNLVNHEWLPISYFGDFHDAKAWTISINPSSREFTDALGMELTGSGKRFAVVRDFPDCASRGDAVRNQLADILALQQSVLRRAPYRPYFSKLGRFIALALGYSAGNDPLAAFTGGLEYRGTPIRFAHLDLVKCATRSPWSKLALGDRQVLIKNCSNYLLEQIKVVPALDLILINGKTALEQILPMLEKQGSLNKTSFDVGLPTTHSTVVYGTMRTGARPVRVVAWSSNVVNQRLRADDYTALASSVAPLLS